MTEMIEGMTEWAQIINRMTKMPEIITKRA